MSDSRRSNSAPAEMTPDERFDEVAAILARGVLRLRKRREFSANGRPENRPDSCADGLDVHAEPTLNVHDG